MYKKGCLLVVVCWSWMLQAQLNDTIVLTNNSYHQEMVDRLYEHPLLYQDYLLEDFTQTSVSFSYKDLGFKRVQTPESSTTYNFNTKGVFALSEKLRLFGSFDFKRLDERNLGYNLGIERTEDRLVLSPNYFFAPKRGDWENQVFDISGGMSYQLTRHWLLGATVNYKNHKAYRIIDPRPDLTLANYLGKAFLGYAYKNHKLSINGGLGRATTTAGILYVDAAQNAPAYPETFTRFSSGYGRIEFNSSYPNYLKKENPVSFGGGYQYKNEERSFRVTYNYKEKIQHTFNRDGDNNVYFEEELVAYKYKNARHQLELLYDYDGDQVDHQLQLHYAQEQGDNYSVKDRGQNYQHKIREVSMGTSWLKLKEKQLLWQVKFDASYQDATYTDLLGYTQKELSFLQLSAQWNKDIWYSKKQVFNLGVSARAYFSLDEQLDVRQVTSDTSFMENVILPDHGYDITQKLGSSLHANYTLRLDNHKSLRFFANYKALFSLDKKYEAYVPLLEVGTASYFTMGVMFFY